MYIDVKGEEGRGFVFFVLEYDGYPSVNGVYGIARGGGVLISPSSFPLTLYATFPG